MMLSKNRRALTLSATYVFASLLLSGCEKEQKTISKDFYAMDTYMSITCEGKNSQEAVETSINRIENLEKELSVTIENSEVRRINNGEKVVISEDVKYLLDRSVDIYDKTKGAFDIALYPLIERWGFRTGELDIPDNSEIKDYLKVCKTSNLRYKKGDEEIDLAEGQGIDFGGIAKGYASDEVVKILRNKNIDSAYMSLGGNVYCMGLKSDNTKWRVGIINPLKPDDTGSLLGVVSVKDKAVVTSGGYERYLEDEQTGKRYHHIIDPDTGYPADKDLLSVTIVCESGVMADGLSTACYVLGFEKAVEYWKLYGKEDKFDIIMMTEDEKIYVTKGLEDIFESESEYSVIEY